MTYSKKFLEHDNPSHPECAARLTAIMDGLMTSPFHEDLEFVEPEPIDEKLLKKIHSEELIQMVKEKNRYGGWLDADTYVCPGSFDIAILAAGGTFNACKMGMEDGGHLL